MQRKRSIRAGALAASALWALACGGNADDGAPRPSGGSMAAPMAAGSPGASAGSAPVIHDVRLNPSTPMPSLPIAAVADVSDPDGDPLRISYSWRVNGVEVVRGARSSALLPELAKGDEVEVVVVASDGRNESEPRSARARVGNRPPVISGIDLEPAGVVRAGDVVKASPLARDADGDDLRFDYLWLVNGVEKGDARELRTEGLRKGDKLRVRVVAADGEDESKPFESDELVLGNTPPRITKLPDVETDSGVFTYRFEAYDADGDRNLRFFLDQAPPGMAVDAITGDLSWRPDASQTGVHPVEVGVKDSQGEGTTFLFEVTVSATTDPAPPASVDD